MMVLLSAVAAATTGGAETEYYEDFSYGAAPPVPCPNASFCDSGDLVIVPNIWKNSTQPQLCGQPPGYCSVCSTCNSMYPKCPCCDVLYSDPKTCLGCVSDPRNAAVCGDPKVSYNCDKTAGSCVIVNGTHGAHPTVDACHTAGCSVSYSCLDDKTCRANVSGTGPFPNLKACTDGCHVPKPTFNCDTHQCVLAPTGGKPGQYSKLIDCENDCEPTIV